MDFLNSFIILRALQQTEFINFTGIETEKNKVSQSYKLVFLLKGDL